ncbi:MAG TPA: DcaP family trimeric outer membrane transporter [Candidatus Eisenbacteria bacterium]|nr:DcaP family trimeric outer membrane transporter [Candidatus Eisenbacteria bacterium]
MKTSTAIQSSIRFCTTLTAVFLFFILPIHAQSQNQDLQQMQDKLQRLEQEIQELKAQLSKAQQAQPPATAPATAPAPTAVERAAEEAQETPAEPTEGGKKNSIDLYGHVMLDSGYEFGQSNPDWFDVMRPTQLASYKGQYAPDGKVYFSVRQTRFGVKTSTATGLGDLKTIFEFELFGTGVDAGQTTFRLRHAYGELSHFGAGQTWSPFMDIDVFPNSLEYWGPNGMVFFRNIQARWAPIQNDKWRLIFAVERPGASADGGIYADRVELQNVKPKFDMPDFSWQVRMMREWGHVQVAGIFRKISWVNTTPNPQVDLGGDALGWGVNVTSNVNVTKKDVARLAVVYGAGIENYMNDAPIDVGVKNNLSNPVKPIEGVALPVLGVVSFIDHNWNSRFSTSIGYSLVNITNSDAETPSDYHQGHYALTNLLYHPVPPVTIGGEFQYGRRVNFSDGFNVNDYRLQFSFKYNWKKVFEF